MALRLESPPPPTDTPSPDGGGGRDWVELFTASGDIECHLVQGRLQAASIETRAVKDRAAPGAWLYGGSNPWAPVTIFVRRGQSAEARLVLAEVAYGMPSAGRPAEASQRGRVPFVWWGTALSLGVFLTALVLLQASRSLSFCQLPVWCDRTPGQTQGGAP